jgi:predicted protein tyrosine phosphatase
MNRRILFVCSQNKLRSPTAEAVFANHPEVDVDSAGLNHDAVIPLSPEHIEWADLILVMEKSHQNRLSKSFRKYLTGKRVIVLNIPDDYDYMEPALGGSPEASLCTIHSSERLTMRLRRVRGKKWRKRSEGVG